MLLVFSLLLIPFAMVLRGIVLSYLWAWFIVPLGAPGLSLAHAVGISIFVTSFIITLARNKDAKHELRSPGQTVGYAYGSVVGNNLTMWVMGAIVYYFFM